MKGVRTGIGFDAHRFVENRKLFLGCVEIPFHKGLDGHSDADVLVHAICDSLLGAAGLGDIGKHFPASNPAYKNSSGEFILERVCEKISEAGFQTVNVDCVVICEQPAVSPHAERMKRKIAAILGAGENRVNIKATTTEKMGFTGRGEGIAAKAVCLIKEKP